MSNNKGTRADLAAPDAAQDDLWSDLELVVECIDIPLPQKDSIVAAIRRTQVKFADAVRQVQRETWDAAIAIVESCQRHSDQTMHASTKGMVGCRAAMLAQLQAAALRAEGKGD